MASIDDLSPEDWDSLTSKWRKTINDAQQKVDKESLHSTDYQPIKPFKLPPDAAARKAIPVYTGFVNYFPRAMCEVAKISLTGGLQHGQTPETLHWARHKSGDELDALMRHIIDKDWAQVAWRAMANLEKQLEREELQ